MSSPALATNSRPLPAAYPGPAGWKPVGLGLLLTALTFLAYSPALTGGLLIDDDSHVTAPELRSLAGLWRIWSVPGATHQYFPVLHSAFWLEYRLWGDALPGYHLLNVLLHAVTACLLVAILRRLAVPGAWFAGALFALHPVCVESVAWISEQKNTLSTCFGLGAVLVFLHFDQTRRRSSYVLATGLFILALLSKTVTLTLSAVLLVIFWWQRGRLEWRRDVAPLLLWFVLGALAILPPAYLEHKTSSTYPAVVSLSWLDRGLLAGRVFWFYPGKLAWPAGLIFAYPHWPVDARVAWQYVFPLAALALAAGLWRFSRRNRGPFATFLIYAGTLAPVLGFVDISWFAFSYVGDHLQYLSCPAILALFAAGVALAADKLPPALRRWAPVGAAGLLVVLGVLTWRQSRMYRDAETLNRATLARNPSCWIAHYNLGDALNGQPGRQAEVIAEWETAVRLRPDFAEGQNNLGCLLAGIPGRVPEAIEHFEAALRARPDFAAAHNNLAAVLGNIPGRAPEAIAHFEAAIRFDPDDAEAHNGLGNLLIDVPGRLADALAEFAAALRLRPDYAEAHWNLGVALAKAPGRLPEAIIHLETALRLKPDLEGGPQMLEQLRERQRRESSGNPAPRP